MRVSEACVKLVQRYEGYHTKLPNGDCQAYLDRLVAKRFRSPGYPGLFTIGWGATGNGITEGTVWTRKKAEADLRRRLDEKCVEVLKAVDVPLNQNQLDALVSFAYNVGDWKKSTLIKRVNQRDHAAAALAFTMYNRAGGKVYRGLVRRRADEAKLYELPERRVIINNSRKLTLLDWFRKTILGVGGLTAIGWDELTQVRDFVAVNQGWIILGLGAVAWLMSKYLIDTSIKDARNLNYTPSGLAEEEVDASDIT